MNTDWLNRSEYPFEHKYFPVNGVNLHYLDEGKGDVVLFVHGTPSWSFEFRYVIRELSKEYRCVAIDHIGFGLSDKPAQYDYSIQNHAVTLTKFIDHLQLKNINLLVHDFGGPIGLKYATGHPENIHKLIILNTWCKSIEQEPEFKKMRSILGSPLLPFLYRYLNFSPRYILPAAFGERTRLTKEIHHHYLKPFAKPSERNGVVAFARSLLNDQQWFETIYNDLHKISWKPTLLIWGMKDQFITEKYLNILIDEFKDAEVIKYEDAGHFVLEEKSMVAAPVIGEFLSNIFK
ncbi:MAG: alpha/beta fold hydrolase [Chitinophagales bacterium]